jgi:predicted ATPase
MRGRLAAAAAAGALTPFVGRQDEMRLLMSRWERAREGDGQVVTIVGEAGIGKSRLLQEFHDRITVDRHTWLECATAAFFQNTPFYAVAEMLRESFHWHNHQNDERRLAALEASLATTGVELATAVPLIASLLEMPLDDKYPRLTMPPEQQRKRLLATLVAWTIGAARAQPLVIATEDLHWADPSTLDVTQLLVEQGVNAPLLLIYTARPEFRASWSARAHHTQITLNHLGVRDIRVLVAQVASSKALPEETVTAVVERTGRVPLFVEELTRAVLDSGDGKLVGRAIPATLQDSLMARLDRLGSAKEVAQIGAVIGSEFSYELLRAMHPIPELEFQQALRRLTDAELLYVRGIAPEAAYQFKHALIRDAAYEALLKSRRKKLHLVVARTIDEKFPAIKDAHPEVLAQHWNGAGELELAIAAWDRAGRRAVRRSANREAVAHFKSALRTVGTLPQSIGRARLALQLNVALQTPLIATTGYTSKEVEAVCVEAHQLSQQLTDGPELFAVLGGLASIHYNRGELKAAMEINQRLLKIAEGNSDPLFRLWAHYSMGFSLTHLGENRRARNHLEQSIALYDRGRAGSYGFVQDPGPTALLSLAQVWNAWVP